MNIEKIENNREKFIDILLLADPDITMIEKYLYIGDIFALYYNDLKSVCIVTKENDDVCEIKNISTYEKYQNKGYGKILIKYIIKYYKDKFKKIIVGTGNSSVSNIHFYKNRGFSYSHIIKDFFIHNYKNEIFENGIQCVDMIYLEKSLDID
ncbi:GNAT family N-acetyltransferase [Clostridium tetani]|uniref:GNAT family N-acetyltransferase n=1 Tax=Clostridium tetani TaxID=1513 RepID=UPI0005133C0C|nr:GNAT family N-acetyltransferase [Clostridium tetani]KGI44884.1 GNAT family acetyltransferase [Clostridium tetani]